MLVGGCRIAGSAGRRRNQRESNLVSGENRAGRMESIITINAPRGRNPRSEAERMKDEQEKLES
jgi:hypothetical protein